MCQGGSKKPFFVKEVEISCNLFGKLLAFALGAGGWFFSVGSRIAVLIKARNLSGWFNNTFFRKISGHFVQINGKLITLAFCNGEVFSSVDKSRSVLGWFKNTFSRKNNEIS